MVLNLCWNVYSLLKTEWRELLSVKLSSCAVHIVNGTWQSVWMCWTHLKKQVFLLFGSKHWNRKPHYIVWLEDSARFGGCPVLMSSPSKFYSNLYRCTHNFDELWFSPGRSRQCLLCQHRYCSAEFIGIGSMDSHQIKCEGELSFTLVACRPGPWGGGVFIDLWVPEGDPIWRFN